MPFSEFDRKYEEIVDFMKTTDEYLLLKKVPHLHYDASNTPATTNNKNSNIPIPISKPPPKAPKKMLEKAPQKKPSKTPSTRLTNKNPLKQAHASLPQHSTNTEGNHCCRIKRTCIHFLE